MSSDARFIILTTLLIAVTSGIFALFVWVVKIVYRMARAEERLNELIADVKQLVEDKDQAHKFLLENIEKSNTANDRRLRWLEEHLWRTGRRPSNGQAT